LQTEMDIATALVTLSVVTMLVTLFKYIICGTKLPSRALLSCMQGKRWMTFQTFALQINVNTMAKSRLNMVQL